MRLLFDQNSSRHLVGMFNIDYQGSRHVTDLGLDMATDAEIWAYAGSAVGQLRERGRETLV